MFFVIVIIMLSMLIACLWKSFTLNEFIQNRKQYFESFFLFSAILLLVVSIIFDSKFIHISFNKELYSIPHFLSVIMLCIWMVLFIPFKDKGYIKVIHYSANFIFVLYIYNLFYYISLLPDKKSQGIGITIHLIITSAYFVYIYYSFKKFYKGHKEDIKEVYKLLISSIALIISILTFFIK